MGMYSYRAYSATGQTITGSLEAENLSALENRLRVAGIWLLDASEGRAVERKQVDRLSLKRADLIACFVQLTLLLRSGITLPNALERMSEDFKDTKLGTVLATLREQVAIGVPLHAAMDSYPRIFTPEICAVVEAGEISGKLPEVFESLQSYYEWLDQLMGDIRQAMIYPVMVMTAALGLILLLFTVVVPKFVSLLTSLSLQVPALTQAVMSISGFLVKGWPLVILAAVGVPLGWRWAMKHEEFAGWFDRTLMDLPIIGPLVKMISLSRFAHNLALLYRAGIPLLRGLEICRGLVGNRAVEEALVLVHRGVLEGKPMSRCLAQHEVFPQTVVTMIATGETSGTLDFALQSIADYYNKIIPRRIKVVFAVFNPVMMLSLIAIVGLVALAVILPILQLWNAR